MSCLSVSGRHLEKDGRPFFWLADTIWTAFTNPTDDEWVEYLDQRAAQGFNVLQINALPQWDRSGAPFDRYPYATEDHGKTFDFSCPVPEFWEHARWQLSEAVKRGFVPAIVVMWCNYVPNTWASNINSANIIPEELVEPVVRQICESFNEFDPIYVVSGDTDFDHEEPLDRYTMIADLMERYAPNALTCYHIKGRYDGLPESLAERADIYLYQSGHNVSAQDGAYTLARSFAGRPVARPIINSEPCYEQIGYSHMIYGRFRRADARRALWLSLVGGASAGVTYGAHGVWNWQNDAVDAAMDLGEGFLKAMPHEVALRFPGADDYGFARRLVERLGLLELEPSQNLLANYEEDVYSARTADGSTTVVYVPTSVTLKLRGDLTGMHLTCYDLLERTTVPVECAYDAEADVTIVMQPTVMEDALLVASIG